MILKTFENGRWTWYDNIEKASSFYDSEAQCMCVSIRRKGSENDEVVKIMEPSYLCNDIGRTIERLFRDPKITNSKQETKVLTMT